jgi:S1-C subfamily serine protease
MSTDSTDSTESSDVSNQTHQIGDVFADAIERAAPGVVAVHGRRRLPATGTVWSAAGASAVIVTASHVIEREDKLAIRLPDESQVPVSLLGRDLSRDIAVVRADTGGLTPVTRREGDARVGTMVMAVGRPWAVSPHASFGTINALGMYRSRRSRSAFVIHADVTMLPGFSGGPLIDAAGRVLGINTSGLGRWGGVTIPVEQIQRVADDIVEYGYVRTAWIGVTVQPVELPAQSREALDDQETGLLVSGIAGDSPATRAGLLVGDILVTLAGQPLTDPLDLKHLLGGDLIGTSLDINALRGGTGQTFAVEPVEHPDQNQS